MSPNSKSLPRAGTPSTRGHFYCKLLKFSVHMKGIFWSRYFPGICNKCVEMFSPMSLCGTEIYSSKRKSIVVKA